MKTKVGVFLAVLMMCLSSVVCLAEETEHETFQFGEFNYYINDDNTVTISAWNGKSDFLMVPNNIDGKIVTTIDEDAIYGPNLVSLEIPASVTLIKGPIFSYCKSLLNITVSPENENYAVIDNVLFDKKEKALICYPAGLSADEYYIPDGIVSIGNYAFENCSNLKKLEVPDSVTTIGQRAFSECGSLTSIKIPDSVTTIGNAAFYSCNNLTNFFLSPDNETFAVIDNVLFNKKEKSLVRYPGGITADIYHIPAGIVSIDDYAFEHCDYLKRVEMPDSVVTIGEKVFWGCRGLTDIKLSNSITTIGKGVFSFCNLTSVNIPRSVTVIEEEAFYSNSNLTSITIPDSVTTIGDEAFTSCYDLTSIKIPDSVVTIGSEAFSYCIRLERIEIPDSVMTIGEGVFSNCSSLSGITISPNHEHYEVKGGVLFDKREKVLICHPAGMGNSEYHIPDDTKSIGESAFAGCHYLEIIEIPNSVTLIGMSAFSNCDNLVSIVIPDSITTIGDLWFSKCGNLTNIEIPDSVTTISSKAFWGCENITLTVNKGSFAAEYAKEHDIPYSYTDANDWLTN